jgi:hypothetical protein
MSDLKKAIAVSPELTLAQKLSKIQFEFKAKKSKYNSFGKYNFRSAEDILEAIKPLNIKYQVYFTVNEQLINSNPPIVNSVATIWDCESSQSIDCSAIVGVDLEQKGMAMPQRYGASSSYGKKYALGNLLLIDDTADPDATNTHGNDTKRIAVNKFQMMYPSKEFEKAQDYLAGGGDIELIEKKYILDPSIKKALLTDKI